MRRRSLCLLLALGCRATSSPASPPADPPAPATIRVHGCVTADGAPAPRAEVTTWAPDNRNVPVPLDPAGCFALERPVDALTQMFATATDRGAAILPLLPVAGDLDVAFALPAARTMAPAELRSRDRASTLAEIAAWYTAVLRGKPTRDNLAAVASRREQAQDPLVRATLGLVYLALARTPKAPPDALAAVDPALLRAALADVDPAHLAWSVEMETIVLASMAGDVDLAYVRRVLDEHPNPQVYGAAAYILADAGTKAKDPAAVRAALARLRARGVSSTFAEFAREYDPDDPLAAGKPLPAFSFRRLAGDGTVDSVAYRGKVLVLHVWSTWCKPCIEQIPALADLYARHAAAGLEVVSLSIDETREAVLTFLETHAMPWTHAWEPPDAAARLVADYQVTSSTKTILVGRDGVVLDEHTNPTHPDFPAKLTAALAQP